MNKKLAHTDSISLKTAFTQQRNYRNAKIVALCGAVAMAVIGTASLLHGSAIGFMPESHISIGLLAGALVSFANGLHCGKVAQEVIRPFQKYSEHQRNY